MKARRWMQVTLASVAFAVQFVVSSWLINDLWLGEAHEAYGFFRPDDDPRVNPGLGVTTLAWSVCISWGYLVFGPALQIRHSVVRGMAFGLLVYVCFVFFQEFFYYLFIQFEWVIIAGALLHYLVAFVLGGAILGAILRE